MRIIKQNILTLTFLAAVLFPAAAQTTYSFSPGTDSPKKAITVPVSISDSRYIKSWYFIVTDSSGKPVYTKKEVLEKINERPENWRKILAAFFKPKQSVPAPKPLVWDGKNDSGAKCPDGTYFFFFTATDDNDNYSETQRYRVVIDTVPPAVTITPPSSKIFGDAAKPAFTISQSGTREDLWTAYIKDKDGKVVRVFEWRDSTPTAVVWDGKNDHGIMLPEGYYSYSISAVDAAGNKSAPAGITDIHLDPITPEAQTGRSVAELAPNGKTGRQTFSIMTNLKTGIENWNYAVVPADGNGGAVREWTRTGDTLPSQLDWDGKTTAGGIAEGSFKGVLTIKYLKGNKITSETAPFLCTGLPPRVTVTTSPKWFSPDGDGSDDTLLMNIAVKSVMPIASWTLTINDPNNKPFKTWSGKSEIPPKIEWNGKGDNGELVESAMDYPYSLTVIDTQTQSALVQGAVTVDVLVIRDGDRYIIRVPAIIFRANNADFKGKADDRRRGLDQPVIDNNIRVLTRIAEILQKFRDYRVMVEGHANSETGTQKEEDEELIPLSSRRAEFVKDWLIAHGVSGSRLSAKGIGGSRPVVKNRKDRDNWWKNRRVEFILQK
ncbi:MAG: OmpA family protein [Spirochaetaceae bacterium]|jgi:flagellar hook assembly protein FlgD|nr:OmpA family protein [Spirochaetaceae bacterium]